MSDNFFSNRQDDTNSNCFKEAVCIDAYRVYDSCSDKDCLEDLRVYFTEQNQQQIDMASNVRLKDVDVLTVYLDLEPIPFQKGFYSVNMTFFFEVCVDAFTSPASMPITLCGLSVFDKKVVLYGSEGNVKVFSSDLACDEFDTQNNPVKNLPRAACQVAEPIALSARICEYSRCCEPSCRIPEPICRRYGGNFFTSQSNKVVYVTIGLFTIVQIERNVQMLIPAYDFCIPQKECVTTSDNPCELFSQIDFPMDEFFPPRVTDISRGSSTCGGCRS